jgi:DNA-binding MarR family transcriptional regulator
MRRIMENPKAEQALLHALVSLSFRLADQTRTVITEVVARLDLTPAQAHALWQLDPDTTAAPMRELALKLSCDPSTVTFLADRMEEKKLIRRQVDPDNRRIKTLVLSAKGCQVRRKLVAAMNTHSPVARLSPDERQQLHALLSKAIQAEVATEPSVLPAGAARSARSA